ncbi:hypothetical protein AL546_003870 [Vibrio vulnificus]|nr:hypothetical protein AL546_003870 [Vibrio vulnificus]
MKASLKHHDHNQLRLTRAIRSLYLLGNEYIARNLCDFLLSATKQVGSVSEKTQQYWCHALEE